MKNLLLGAVCLSLFAISFSLVQISCSKTEAQNSNNQITSINKILVSQYIGPGQINFTIMNYDGTSVQVLNIPLPAGFNPSSSYANSALSADGTKIFFAGKDSGNPTWGIYSCDTSGANLTRIHNSTASNLPPEIGGAY